MFQRSERITTIVVLACLIPACAAYESVRHPPTIQQMSRINEFAAAHGSIRVDYVEPIPLCPSDGPCRQELKKRAVKAESVQFVGEQLVIQTSQGVGAVPATAVDLINVKDRGRGALIGGAVGGGAGLTVGLVLVGFLAYLARNWPNHDPERQRDVCEGLCTKLAFTFTAAGALTGVLIGALAGSRRVFEFGGTASSESQ